MQVKSKLEMELNAPSGKVFSNVPHVAGIDHELSDDSKTLKITLTDFDFYDVNEYIRLYCTYLKKVGNTCNFSTIPARSFGLRLKDGWENWVLSFEINRTIEEVRAYYELLDFLFHAEDQHVSYVSYVKGPFLVYAEDLKSVPGLIGIFKEIVDIANSSCKKEDNILVRVKPGMYLPQQLFEIIE